MSKNFASQFFIHNFQVVNLERRIGLPDVPALYVSAPSYGGDGLRPTVTFVYKVAAEVGRLGDNGAELRRQIREDKALRLALRSPDTSMVLLGHTRWASSGVISVPNCHPVDNAAFAAGDQESADSAAGVRGGRIFVVMNGDVDNHLALREAYRERWGEPEPAEEPEEYTGGRCQSCDEAMPGRSSVTRYCCNACRQAAYRARLRAA